MAFHLLHERCGSRIQNRSYCPVCNVAVPREELVRGFEFVKDEYVRITDEGLKAFESQDGRVIDVREFLPIDTVDPVYFDRTSYLGPGKGGEQGYQLLRHAMAKTGRVTVPKYTMRGKQRLVLLRPVGEGFHLHTLYYADEVADFAEVERPDVRVKPGELELAVRLIEDLAQAEFRPEQYADEYRVRVRAVVERKRAGGTIGATKPRLPRRPWTSWPPSRRVSKRVGRSQRQDARELGQKKHAARRRARSSRSHRGARACIDSSAHRAAGSRSRTVPSGRAHPWATTTPTSSGRNAILHA